MQIKWPPLGALFLFGSLYGYNKDMMNEKYNAPNSPCCGRPMYYAPQQKCKYNDCCMNEYCGKMPACIRNKQPDCLAKAVIPSVTVETVDGITNLANCFVHVTSTNTTYYIDDKHRPMIIWAGPVEIDDYDIATNPLNLRAQDLYTTIGGVYKLVRFDKQGVGHVMAIELEEV